MLYCPWVIIILETAIQQQLLLHKKRGYVILSLGDNHFRNSYTITAAVTREVRINCAGMWTISGTAIQQ
jgi:hypothetical protein